MKMVVMPWPGRPDDSAKHTWSRSGIFGDGVQERRVSALPLVIAPWCPMGPNPNRESSSMPAGLTFEPFLSRHPAEVEASEVERVTESVLAESAASPARKTTVIRPAVRDRARRAPVKCGRDLHDSVFETSEAFGKFGMNARRRTKTDQLAAIRHQVIAGCTLRTSANVRFQKAFKAIERVSVEGPPGEVREVIPIVLRGPFGGPGA